MGAVPPWRRIAAGVINQQVARRIAFRRSWDRTERDPMYILLLLAVAVVLAFVLEFLLGSVPESGDGTSDAKLDRGVLVRLATAGAATALVLVGGLIAAYLVNPDWGKLVGEWPLIHPSSLLLSGVAFYPIALLCGVKPRQPVLLVCLTLPGLVVMPLLLLAAIVTSNHVVATAGLVPIVFFLQPAVWILLFIAIGQTRLLRKAGGSFTAGGLVRIFLISVAYLFGTFS